MIRFTSALVCVLVVGFFCASDATAQLQGNSVDPTSRKYYSPDDFHHASHWYRVQAGYAGLYDDCDGEEQKRYSPYIYWRNRTDVKCRLPYVRLDRIIAWDVNDKVQRMVDGAGPCACSQCNPGLGPAIERNLKKAMQLNFTSERHCESCER